MPAPTDLVTLRTGGDPEPFAIVQVLSVSLTQLFETNPVAFYELVMYARDPNHQLFGNTGEVLRALSLIDEDGRMHRSTRAVVLACSEGDNGDMTLVPPLA